MKFKQSLSLVRLEVLTIELIQTISANLGLN
jgi:hypothetical protein